MIARSGSKVNKTYDSWRLPRSTNEILTLCLQTVRHEPCWTYHSVGLVNYSFHSALRQDTHLPWSNLKTPPPLLTRSVSLSIPSSSQSITAQQNHSNVSEGESHELRWSHHWKILVVLGVRSVSGLSHGRPPPSFQPTFQLTCDSGAAANDRYSKKAATFTSRRTARAAGDRGPTKWGCCLWYFDWVWVVSVLTWPCLFFSKTGVRYPLFPRQVVSHRDHL